MVLFSKLRPLLQAAFKPTEQLQSSKRRRRERGTTVTLVVFSCQTMELRKKHARDDIGV